MDEVIIDETIVQQGIKSAVATLYKSLLLRCKDEAKAKKQVVEFLSEVGVVYGKEEPAVQSEDTDKPQRI